LENLHFKLIINYYFCVIKCRHLIKLIDFIVNNSKRSKIMIPFPVDKAVDSWQPIQQEVEKIMQEFMPDLDQDKLANLDGRVVSVISRLNEHKHEALIEKLSLLSIHFKALQSAKEKTPEVQKITALFKHISILTGAAARASHPAHTEHAQLIVPDANPEAELGLETSHDHASKLDHLGSLLEKCPALKEPLQVFMRGVLYYEHSRAGEKEHKEAASMHEKSSTGSSPIDSPLIPQRNLHLPPPPRPQLRTLSSPVSPSSPAEVEKEPEMRITVEAAEGSALSPPPEAPLLDSPNLDGGRSCPITPMTTPRVPVAQGMHKVSSGGGLSSELLAFKFKHHFEQHEKVAKSESPQPSPVSKEVQDRLAAELEREAKRKAAEAAEEAADEWNA
jgi:hypothetical protein